MILQVDDCVAHRQMLPRWRVKQINRLEIVDLFPDLHDVQRRAKGLRAFTQSRLSAALGIFLGGFSIQHFLKPFDLRDIRECPHS